MAAQLKSLCGWLLLFWLGTLSVSRAEDDGSSSVVCSSDSLPLSKQTPNTFFKVCPEQRPNSVEFGQPICGDGTEFGFYVTRPPQKYDFSTRVLIEFVGGGACWDAQTCEKQANYLTAPNDKFDAFVGISCTEAAVAMQDSQFNMLCATQLGETNMAAYTTIIVPYCTQDCHGGDNTIVYQDNDGDGDNNGNGNVVNHVGAHNMMSVLRYVFRNFDRPSYIVLTGCSAGGTAVPLAYHLLHQHYSSFGTRSTQISVLADSPVFLTPTYFLENAFDNWNTRSLVVKRIGGFSYRKWRYKEEFPVRLWEHILHKGSNKDQWAFVSHEDDPISQAYYTWMGGNYDNGDGDENDDYVISKWYSELTTAISSIESKHRNVHSYWYNDESAHCSFGLYYPLQQDGFAEWAGDIVKEQRLAPMRHIGSFVFSILMGFALVFGSIRSSRRAAARAKEEANGASTTEGEGGGDFVMHDEEKDTTNDHAEGLPADEGGADNNNNATDSSSWQSKHTKAKLMASKFATKAGPVLRRGRTKLEPFFLYFSECPITSGYALALTFNFWIMMALQGFTHPINNPSLGPTAMELSKYGINNPALIVYQMELTRLVTSCFVCSGILTYLLTMSCLWFYVRILEKQVGWRNLATIMALIGLGANLVYAYTANGASCTSLALVLGVNAFDIAVRMRQGQAKCMITTMTAFIVLLTCLVFTFNSWIMIVASLLLGVAFSRALFETSTTASTEYIEGQQGAEGKLLENGCRNYGNNLQLKRRVVRLALAVYAILTFALLVRLRRPDKLYMEPFYTGCDLKYLDNVGSSQFYGGEDANGEEGGEDRRLGGEDDDNDMENMCAQFCVPHLASRGVSYGARRFFNFDILTGTCEDIGYDEHVADKTFEYFTYSLDVEIYQNENADGEDGNNE